ncbi:MAG: type II secretion system F family protein [Bacillota bacterium]
MNNDLISMAVGAASIPGVLPAALLAPAAVISVYVCRNPEKFKKTLTRLKDILEYEAAGESFLDKYRLTRDTAYKLKKLKFPLNYNLYLLLNIAISIFIAVLCATVLKNYILSGLSVILWLLFSHQLVDRLYRALVKARIDTQAQLVLQLLAELYQVSDNLVQAVERVIPSSPEPIKSELEMLIIKYRTNQDLGQCLMDFAANIDNRDIEIFVEGIILAEQYGTSTHEVITQNAEVIRERISLKEDLFDETKGKKTILYIFMIALPALFLWLFTGFEEARKTFAETTRGQLLVTFLAMVEYICWWYDSRKEVTEDL